MATPPQETQQLGQSIWYDNIRRGLLTSGEMEQLIELGITGVTSNPTIFEKAIVGSTDYDEALVSPAMSGTDVREIYETLVVEDIRRTADLLRPVYERTSGADGYASLEVSPILAHDTDGTVAEAQRLLATLDRPNVMIKVPATPEGAPAVRYLIGAGVNVNVTLIFSLDVYRQVMEAYIAGLEDLVRAGGDVGHVASVASFFVSRVDTAVDALLDERICQGEEGLKALRGKAAIANAKLAYQAFRETFGDQRFAALQARGARVQRPLWASTGTKDPSYSDVLYVESLIGRDTVNTVPPATLTVFLEHGNARATLERDVPESERTLEALAAAGVNIHQVTEKLLDDGVNSFVDSLEALLANIAEKRAHLLTREHAYPDFSLGTHIGDVKAALTDLQRHDVVGRIWRKEHTVWKSAPKEISDRLGWLNVSDLMCEQVPALEAFAAEVRDTGIRHVVLLGMGGSSLGPEVLRQTFGSRDGYPEFMVLDSTVPTWVQAITNVLDPARSLFLVSSKSGTTTEPNVLYRYFRALVEEAVGEERAGEHFVAITDPGTPLEQLAREQGFRRTFLNPPNIGGRYSVLSYFGLAPAALMGIDVAALINRADRMRERCASWVSVHENPGARLGAAMATLARKGRDKLTLATSPSIAGFGLWVEQLIAESTGKEGKGIVPVAGEPVMDPVHYSDDRLFIYLRLEDDDNAHIDAAMQRVESSGQPVVRLDLRDRYDLGAEFFRWQFATALAGSLLGIHPFDQPNVQEAKGQTARALEALHAPGELPRVEAEGSLKELLGQARPGDYLAIMAYLQPTQEAEQALADLRRRVLEKYGIATTLGYGPRFLHSTGQLHKGGPATGLFLQILETPAKDLPIPGEAYTFGGLAEAQALGDLQILQMLGRRIARVRLGADNEAGISKLGSALV